jgi:hypothetical protein
VAPASQRYQSDRADNRPRTPKLDLKTQNSEVTNEVRQKQETKDQKKREVPAKTDMLEEKELSVAAPRPTNWGILKNMIKYIWPKVNYTVTKLMKG